MQIVEAHGIKGFQAVEAIAVRFDEVPPSEEEWLASLPDLNLEAAYTMAYGHIGAAALARLACIEPDRRHAEYMARQAGKRGRDWWSTDKSLHLDRSAVVPEQVKRSGQRYDVNTALTVLAYNQADPGAPGTVLLDTVALHARLEIDGFWGSHDIEDSAGLVSEFCHSQYYRGYLPSLQPRMTAQERQRLAAIEAQDLDKWACSTPEEMQAKMDSQRPPRTYPTIAQTPLFGSSCIMVDAGVRQSRLYTPSAEADWPPADHYEALADLRRTYLDGNRPFDLGIAVRITCANNQGVIFPRSGTLHAAEPNIGPDNIATASRVAHVGFYNQLEPAV